MEFNKLWLWEIHLGLESSPEYAWLFVSLLLSSFSSDSSSKVFLLLHPRPALPIRFFICFEKNTVTWSFFFPIFVKFSFFYKNFCLWIRLNQLIEYKYQILVLWYFVHFLGHHSSKFFNYLNYRCFLLYIAWISLLHCKKNICNIKLKMKNKD